MRFEIDHPNPNGKGTLEIVLGNDGTGFAVDARHHVAYYVAQCTPYEFAEGVEMSPTYAERLIGINNDGITYTLMPHGTTPRIDKFAAICDECVKITSDDAAAGIFDVERSIDSDKAKDLRWCIGIIKRKFGQDTDWEYTSPEVVNQLKDMAKDRGFSPYTPPPSSFSHGGRN